MKISSNQVERDQKAYTLAKEYLLQLNVEGITSDAQGKLEK